MQLKELAHMSESAFPAVTRILFSKQDVQAREFIRAKMRDAGLEVRWGTLFACMLDQNTSNPTQNLMYSDVFC
jgi:hypothetical protein